MEQIRLQKYMAMCGVASRRACEEIIASGRVMVNNTVVTEQGTKVSELDRVTVDGKRIRPEAKKVYIIMNKPSGCVTTSKDQFERPAVVDLLDGVKERVYPVGRLDYDTTGLLLLTNDGDFMNKITHPSRVIEKTYIARTSYTPDEEDIALFKEGIPLEDGITAPAELTVLEPNLVTVKLHEGRYHQVKRMLDYIDCPVKWLKRIAIGGLELGRLPEGKWRYLFADEIKKIFE